MKRIFKIILFFSLTLAIFPVNAQPFSEIHFDQLDHSFGKIREEAGPAVFNFSFTNTGTIPLIIQGVEASCGCTTPEWSQEPILPGKKGFIKVSYNPEQRPGIFAKSITVNANVPKTTRVLTISGEVIPRPLTFTDLYPVDFGAIRLSSGELSFVKIKNNEVKTDTLQIYNPGTSPVSVNYKIVPPHITIRTIPTIIPPKSKGFFLITFDAVKKQEYGFVTNRIYLSFNGEDKFENAIKVSGIIEEDFSKLSAEEVALAPLIEYDSRTFDFGEIPEGKIVTFTFVIKNSGKRDLIIRNVSTTCGCTTGQPGTNTIPPGGKTDMKVSFDSHQKGGMQNKIITVISNDPVHTTTILRVTGNVKR